MSTASGAATVSGLLAEELRRAPGRPFVTFYDDRSGERVELSLATYANWVAKTAGLLQDELGLDRGDTVLVDLPPHWLGTVWLASAWSLGLSVATDPVLLETADTPVGLVVCGPDRLPSYADPPFLQSGIPVVALSLRPMATRFLDPVPDGILDYGLVVWGQPDAFSAYDPPTPDDLAWRGPHHQLTQAELLASDRAADRVLTDLDPVSPEGARLLVGALAGGGTVWVAHPAPDSWERRSQSERVTRVVRRSA